MTDRMHEGADTMSGFRTITVDVEVDLSELDDDDLLDEMRARGFAIACETSKSDARALADDVMSHLLGKRHDRARDAMRALVAAFLPPEIAAAAEALDNGRHAQAICDLDDFIAPPPSATAQFLPSQEGADV